MNELLVRDLGRMDYDAALAEQRRVHAAVVDGAVSTVLLVEHDPVVTISKKPAARSHLLAGEAMLASHGVQVCQTDRGGDITYHGPGQIVAYPIIDLRPRKLNLRQYVWLLEQTIIDTLAKFDIAAHRDQCAVGVWVGGKSEVLSRESAAADRPPLISQLPTQDSRPTSGGAKIAAIGVRGSRWVTMHGLALNVSPNMDHYKLIVPCGLIGRPVTSMKQQLGDRCPGMDDVKKELSAKLCEHLAIGNTHELANLPAR